MEDDKSTVSKNTIYNVLKTFSTIVFPLITFPYISRVLHAENVGKINFGSSIVSYFSLIATLGITAYAVRECSKVKHDKKKLSEISSQILSINICTTFVSYTLLILCLILIPKLKNYHMLIVIQSLSIIFTSIGADWLNNAMEDFRYITIRTFTFQLIAVIAMLLFVHKPEHYIIYAFICLISTCGAQIANVFYRRRFCTVYFTLHIDWKKHFPPIILLFVMVLSQQILNSLDVTMLGFIKGDSAVGLYSITVKVINLVSQIVESVTWVVMPQLSYQYSIKNYSEINKLLRYSTSFTAALVLPCFTGIVVMSEQIVYLVGGTEFLPAASCLRILSLSMLIRAISNIYGNLILLPSNREKRFMFACLISALVNMVTNLIFIPIMGINGASITTVLSSLIVTVIVMTGIEKEVNIGNIKSLFKAPIVGTIAVSIICLIARTIIKNILLCVVIAGIICIPLYLFILLRMKHDFALEMVEPLIKKLKVKGIKKIK